MIPDILLCHVTCFVWRGTILNKKTSQLRKKRQNNKRKTYQGPNDGINRRLAHFALATAVIGVGVGGDRVGGGDDGGGDGGGGDDDGGGHCGGHVGGDDGGDDAGGPVVMVMVQWCGVTVRGGEP